MNKELKDEIWINEIFLHNQLGNEIQSIAARQFLPQIDSYVEHEKLNLFKSHEKVKMIMNGWYMDCVESWPPSEDIEPLLISMHFNTSFNNTKEVIARHESRDFFFKLWASWM